jgi:hypothetical protein
MSDGGMGSLRSVNTKPRRRFGSALGYAQFRDSDGILVLAALDADQDGDLFELDIWKVDVSSLQRIPPKEDLQISSVCHNG